MQVSHSRIQTFVKCPYQFKLRYIDNLTTLPADDPANPLILGHALHTGIEKDVAAAIEEYYNAYPIITDNHITEAIKLEYWIPKIKGLLPEGEHEIKIEDEDFVGFIDLLVPVNFDSDLDGSNIQAIEYDLYDFKYSNNIGNYLSSEQLHLYKYYFEKLNPGKKIRNMYFMFVPKCALRIKYKNKTNPRDETIYEFRKRVVEDLDSKQIEFVQISYDPNKVIDFLTNTKHAIECKEFHKQESRLCDWCQYQQYCESNGQIDIDIIYPEKFCQEGIDYELIKRGEE